MIPEYIYDIWSSGLCPGLVRGGRYFDGSDMRCVYDLSDTVSFSERMEEICTERFARDRDIGLLELLRQAVRAAAVCDDWLVPVRFLDFGPEDIRCAESGEVRFILASEGSERCPDILSGIESILTEASAVRPELHAGSILKRIKAEGLSSSSSFTHIERAFSAWASGL